MTPNVQPRILLVEDDIVLAASLRDFLSGEGYAVSLATTCAEARAMMAANYDLILLDWMLPDGSGIDLLKSWQNTAQITPVIMLTAKADTIDKILGLELGAGDYLTKPFDSRELLARIRAQLRTTGRNAVGDPDRVVSQNGDLVLVRSQRRIIWRGREIGSTKIEFDLLALLVNAPDRVFSRDELLDTVWGYDHYPTTRTVDTHILQLRQKLEDWMFETVRGVGYRYRDSGPPDGDKT